MYPSELSSTQSSSSKWIGRTQEAKKERLREKEGLFPPDQALPSLLTSSPLLPWRPPQPSNGVTFHEDHQAQNPSKFAVSAAKGYKMKTHKASTKRFRVTGKGKIVRRRAGKQHLLGKNTKRMLRLSKIHPVDRSDYVNVIGALPLPESESKGNLRWCCGPGNFLYYFCLFV